MAPFWAEADVAASRRMARKADFIFPPFGLSFDRSTALVRGSGKGFGKLDRNGLG
jgi:hypothetical protein